MSNIGQVTMARTVKCLKSLTGCKLSVKKKAKYRIKQFYNLKRSPINSWVVALF